MFVVSKISSVIAHLFHPRRSNKHRARVLHPEAIGYLILIAIGFLVTVRIFTSIPGLGGVLGYASNISPEQVVSQTNAQRASNGLQPLNVNGTLTAAAHLKAQDMMANQYWAHNSPQGKRPWDFMRQAGYGYRVAGENLARDFGDTGSMVAAWMASPTHRANIVNSQYQEIGVAVVNGTLQGVETTLVVQMFGSPTSAPAQVTQQAANAAPETSAAPTPVVSPVPTQQPEVVETTAPATANLAEVTIPETAIAPATGQEPQSAVLASMLVPFGELDRPPLFSPLQLSKAFFLGIVLMIVFTLLYDTVVISNKNTLRFVGKNTAHILLLLTVAYILIFFKGGIVQ